METSTPVAAPAPVKIKNVHTKVFARACDDLGIPYRAVFNTHALWVTSKKGEEVLMYKAISPLNIAVYSRLSKNKREVIFTLKKAGIPVPEQIRVNTLEDLAGFFQIHPKLVVKPIDSHGGKGITVMPKESELQEAYTRAFNTSRTGKVIAEEFIAGKNYRFLVLDDKVLAVALRLPPFITGDGQTNVATLIANYNAVLRAKGIPQVIVNSYILHIIENQGFKPEDVPAAGVQIYLRLTSNLSLGGTVQDVTATVHESYKEMAVEAAKAVHLRLVGIDVIATDLTQPGQECKVIETNAAPGMRIHYKDAEGAKLDVAKEIVKAVYEL